MDNYNWDISKVDPMIIEIKKDGVKLFSIFIGEAMELAGRRAVMKHVRECDRSDWITSWHMEAMDEVVEILKGNTG